MSVLGIACICGRSMVVPCPTVGDIPAAQEQFAGWHYDERGFACCSECRAIPTGTARLADALPAARDQLGLFETRAVE